MWILLCILVSITVGLAGFVALRERELSAFRKDLVNPRLADESIESDRKLPLHTNAARLAWGESRIPWPAALEALELADTGGVTVNVVEYLANERSISIEVAIDGPGNLSEYLDTLNRGSPVWRWSPLSSSHAPSGTGVARLAGTVERLQPVGSTK